MKSNRLTRAASVTAISAGLFAGTFGVASAAITHHPAKVTTHATATAPSNGAPGDHHGPDGFRGLGGVITAINGSTLTVSGPDGKSISVVMTSSTTISRDGATVTQASLAVGDHINVRPDMASLQRLRRHHLPPSMPQRLMSVRLAWVEKLFPSIRREVRQPLWWPMSKVSTEPSSRTRQRRIKKMAPPAPLLM